MFNGIDIGGSNVFHTKSSATNWRLKPFFELETGEITAGEACNCSVVEQYRYVRSRGVGTSTPSN